MSKYGREGDWKADIAMRISVAMVLAIITTYILFPFINAYLILVNVLVCGINSPWSCSIVVALLVGLLPVFVMFLAIISLLEVFIS